MITINDKEVTGVNITLNVTRDELIHFAHEVASEILQSNQNQTPKDEPEEWVTREVVSKRLSVSLTTLWHWNNKGILNSYRMGNMVRYKWSEVEKSMISINGEGK